MQPRFIHFIFVSAIWLCTSVSSAKIEIPFYTPSGATTESSRTYKELVDIFESYNPDIKILFRPANNYNDVLNTVIALAKRKKSSGVSIIEISELLTLKDSDAIIPLDAFIAKRRSFLSQFKPAFLENSYAENGALYGIPVFRSTPVILYNLDLLQTVGVGKSNLPKSWDELTELLIQLKEETGRAQFTLPGDWTEWIFEAFVIQNGGALANPSNTEVWFDKPTTIEALSYWKMLNQKGLLRQMRNWKGSLNYFTYFGKSAVTYYSSGGMHFVSEKAKFNWTSSFMPKNVQFGTPVGGANLFISKHMSEREQEAAWTFVEFLLQTENQVKISKATGYFPVTEAAFETPELKRVYEDHAFAVNKEQLEFSRPKIMTRNYVKVRELLKEAINDALNNDMSAKAALEKAQKKAQAWL
ncbi:ABC transporter substrate-binding protein [Pleionea sediminis]|uniref:ABC transporter substrate-binding protein n=1 Tax=Pleionea sediminis TaxID=2569479 RepID=UPI001185E68C|nr:ABC transporter substrate-binding protein [Pleionea sediminis]